jgi:DNA-directed RNA polymerase sigma subunit (sigma70/sigma32)
MADVATAEPSADLTIEQEAEQLLTDADPDQVEEVKAAAVKTLLDELVDIVEYLKPVSAKNKRRIRIYLLLAELEVPIKDVAAYIGVTSESVRQALLKARRGRDGK